MSILGKLFHSEKGEINSVRFGRASEEFKTPEQVEMWNHSMEAFESQKYFESFEYLLNYLSIPDLKNIRYDRAADNIRFELEQGSKVLVGDLGLEWFVIKAKIARGEGYSIGVMRKLLESGLDLQYCRYSIDKENYLCLVFDGFISEASPYRLFFGLREMAIKADKLDDLLLDEFEHLTPIHNHHIISYPDSVIKVRTDFYYKTLLSALDSGAIGSLNADRHPGAWTYIFLSAIYKIDYLVCPEGRAMELIENAHLRYFNPDGSDVYQKSEGLRKAIHDLSELPVDRLKKEIYKVNHTFGVKSTVPFQTIAEFITAELSAIEWYRANKHDKICFAICTYITGYILFSFSAEEPVLELLHFYYRCDEPEYFRNLGFDSLELSDDPSFKMAESKLKSAVKKILSKYDRKYPGLNSLTDLNCDSKLDFYISLLLMVRDLNIKS
jgi:hypothetical protein